MLNHVTTRRITNYRLSEDTPRGARKRSSIPHRRRLDRQSGAAPSHVEFKRDGLVGKRRVGNAAYVEYTAFHPLMKRHQALVTQPIDREAVGLTLAQKIGAQILAVVPLMAARAGEIELTVTHIIELLAFLEPWRHRPIDARVHRHAARLEAHIGGHRGQFSGAKFPWRGLHPLAAADVDLLLQVHRLLKLFAPFRHRGADTFHALCRILMAARAGFAGRTVRPRPQVFALLNREKSRIVEIVVLDRLGLLGAEPVSRHDLP